MCGVVQLECRSMSHEEIVRIAAALRTAIRLSGISHRQVERELGLSTGYLTRILAGQVELRVRHVLDVCRVIGLPPDRFFGALFPPQDGPESMSRLERGLAQLHPPPGRPAPLPGESSEARSKPVSELLRRLRQAMEDLEAALR
jgi:transcriptional regulator with XRE-family HTH domain